MTDEYPYDNSRVSVEKKVFDTLQKNNLDLMEKPNEENAELNKVRLALDNIYWRDIWRGSEGICSYIKEYGV